MDYTKITVRMSMMNEVQFLFVFVSEPCKPLKSRFLDVVFLVEKDVRVKRHRACDDHHHINVCANDMTKCVATATTRKSVASGRSHDTVSSICTSFDF